MQPTYDVTIIGGGMVGASLACALSGQGLRIALVEAKPYATEPASYDDRTLALAYGSQRIFSTLGLWDSLVTTPILTIHISEVGQPSFVRLDHRSEGVPALGYVIAARLLASSLHERLSSLADIDVLAPAKLEKLSLHSQTVAVSLDHDGQLQEFETRLLVAADGVHSQVRQQLDIDVFERHYGQSAIIANISPEQAHQHIAYERFTSSGPLALLPLDKQRCALVYSIDDSQLEPMLGLSDADFMALVEQRFGGRLGRFLQIGKRSAFPLNMIKARQHNRHRVALIGNAAHTLHPIAGQGFNLGLRDVAALAEVIVDAQQAGTDIGDDAVLKRYADWRNSDQWRALAFTDGLARLFSNNLPPLRLARALGLSGLNLLPPAKHLLARHSMGLAGRLPRLARGLPLLETV